MIRMLKEEDIFAVWWWLNWYITHTRSFRRQEPLDNREFSEGVRRAKADMPWLVLLEDDVPCALACIYERTCTEGSGWGGSVLVCTAPDRRRQGYGRRILKALMELAEKDGYAYLQAGIIPANEAGHALMNSCGFPAADSGGEEDVRRYEFAANTGHMDMPENTDPYGSVRPNRVPV
ncbi:MAG: GNAT family N-acetyltransferase [Solobacterium sp.]|nr:GNAT family N-acetyltransferase [Solobacterium sp.]